MQDQEKRIGTVILGCFIVLDHAKDESTFVIKSIIVTNSMDSYTFCL